MPRSAMLSPLQKQDRSADLYGIPNPDAHGLAGCQTLPIQPRPVSTAEILDEDLAGHVKQSVPPRGCGIPQHDVAVAAATDAQTSRRKQLSTREAALLDDDEIELTPRTILIVGVLRRLHGGVVLHHHPLTP